MEEKRCYGCMNIKKNAVCEHCGHSEAADNQPHQLPCGTILAGRYMIGKVMGQSAVCITYIAWDKKAEAPVAIKEYYPANMAKREGTLVTSQNPAYGRGLSRFVSEAAKLSGIRGLPQIVRVHGCMEENGTAYMVMEYIKGTDLQTYIRRKGRLTMQETITLLRPLMSAVSVMHSDGITHGAISPDHILLLPNGGAKLLDFSSAASEAGLKNGFAAPEQYDNSGVGPWTDVYAFCAVIYFCLKGSAPVGTRQRMVSGTHVDWSGVPTLNGRQQIALDKGMAIRKKDRLQSMEELSRELFAPVNHISRPKAAPQPQPQRQPAPAPRPVAPVNHIPAQRTTPVNFAPMGGDNGFTTPVVEEPPKKNNKNVGIIVAAVLVALVIGFFTVHIWEDPTCESPAVCKICKQEKGEPLGHDWNTLTCIQDKSCKNCGEVLEKAPGHDWIPATYEKPKECYNCGITEGNVKGYVGDVEVVDTSEEFWRTYNKTYWSKLERTLESCMGFTLNFQLTDVEEGSGYGYYEVYIRKTDGSVEMIHGFNVDSQEKQEVEIKLDPTKTFDAVAVVCQNHGFSISFSVSISDVQLKVD